MDIKQRIEQVINEKGLTKKVVAERMGKFNQAFNSLLTNPKWETIESVATAIGITTQEMLFGIKPDVVAPQEQQASQPASPATVRQQEQKQGADELPFDNGGKQMEVNNDAATAMVGLVRCPKCGHSIRLFGEGAE